MKIMLDVNVMLDVAQERQPYYACSAIVVSEVLYGNIEGLLAGHAITTLYYLIAKHHNRQVAEHKVDWMLKYFRCCFRRENSVPSGQNVTDEGF